MQKFSRGGIITITVLAVSVVTLTIAALIPSTRQALRQLILKNERVILAKTSGMVTPQGPNVTVFKILDQGVLVVEIYAPDANGSPQLLQRISLGESRDGYFNFMGNATNLAMNDTAHIGQLDILVPTFDDQMTPRLHVLRYNAEIKHFDQVTAPTDNSR